MLPALKTFIIYARADAPFKNELLKHLNPFVEHGLIQKWVDSDLLPGEEWEKRIEHELDAAELVIFLLSADALHSEFIRKKELKKSLEKKRAGNARIVPVLVRDCFWEIEPELSQLQVLPLDENGQIRAISGWNNRDAAWTSCLREIKRLIDTIRQKTEPQKKPANKAPRKQAAVVEAIEKTALPPAEKKSAVPQVSVDPLDMVKVQSGAFKGSYVRSFEIAKFPVTQKFFREILPYPGGMPWIYKGDDIPMGQCWLFVQEFLQKLNARYPGNQYRLPTEEEWEYAATGGHLSRGYTYAGSHDIDEVAWYDGNSGNEIHPTGLKKPNELGLYDMSGNVFEWCSDALPIQLPEPHTAMDKIIMARDRQHVLKGGCYLSSPDNCRAARRILTTDLGTIKRTWGFRLARSL